MPYQNRPTTANAVVIHNQRVLLIRRANDPFKDYWAIPGGFVKISEDTKAAALRELAEETGVQGEIARLVGIYDAPQRDPRHTVNVAWMVKVRLEEKVKAGGDAKRIRWFPLNDLPRLAFDHAEILGDAQKLIEK